MLIEDLKNMKIGDEKVAEIYAGVDDKSLKLSNGNRIKKDEILTIPDSKGRESFFEVKRILGGTYLVLVERGKKRKLSLIDAFKMGYLIMTRRRL